MAAKKPVKKTAKSRVSAKRAAAIEASSLATMLMVLFTALCVVFACVAYINYGA